MALRADQEGLVLSRRKQNQIDQSEDHGAAGGLSSARKTQQAIEPGRSEAEQAERKNHSMPHVPAEQNGEWKIEEARKEQPMLIMLATKLRERKRAPVIRRNLRAWRLPLVPKWARDCVLRHDVNGANDGEQPARDDNDPRENE